MQERLVCMCVRANWGHGCCKRFKISTSGNEVVDQKTIWTSSAAQIWVSESTKEATGTLWKATCTTRQHFYNCPCFQSWQDFTISTSGDAIWNHGNSLNHSIHFVFRVSEIMTVAWDENFIVSQDLNNSNNTSLPHLTTPLLHSMWTEQRHLEEPSALAELLHAVAAERRQVFGTGATPPVLVKLMATPDDEVGIPCIFFMNFIRLLGNFSCNVTSCGASQCVS